MFRGLVGIRRSSGRWFGRHPRVTGFVERALQLLLIAGGVLLLLVLPVDVLLIASKLSTQSGDGLNAAIRIDQGVRILLAGTLGAMAVLSAVVAGFSRHFFHTVTSDRWTILLPVAASFALFIWVGHVFRHAIGLIDARIGDNPIVVGYLAAWVLIIGYVCKVPWDEARDRWWRSAADFWTVRAPSERAG